MSQRAEPGGVDGQPLEFAEARAGRLLHRGARFLLIRPETLIALAAVEPVKRGVTDVSAQIAKLQAAKPEVTFLVLTPGPGAQALKERQKIGWNDTLMVSSGPLTDERYLGLAGDAAEGVEGLSLWPDPLTSDLAGVRLYRDQMQKYFGKNEPNRYSLSGYFAAMLFAEGARRAGAEPHRRRVDRRAREPQGLGERHPAAGHYRRRPRDAEARFLGSRREGALHADHRLAEVGIALIGAQRRRSVHQLRGAGRADGAGPRGERGSDRGADRAERCREVDRLQCRHRALPAVDGP